MEEMSVGTVIISEQKENSKNYEKFKSIIKNKKTNIQIVMAGDKITIDEWSYIDIISPTNNLIEENAINNNSIVAKLQYNNFSMLFTGDIEKIAEQNILKQNNITLNSTILKIAHHGSKTSTTDEFLSRVNPKIAVIGVGKDNMFGHPSNETIKKLEKVKIYRTDLNGEIEFKVSKNGKVEIKSMHK